MAFITNQWLKGGARGRHNPIPVKISTNSYKDEWNDDNDVVIQLCFYRENEDKYRCQKCAITTTQRGSIHKPPKCSHCDKQTNISDKVVVEHDEFQQAYLAQEDIGLIIKDLFLSNSIESNTDFLRDIIPSISDEFKFELIKLLLKDKGN
jgi:hypothetical protein